MAMRAQPFKLNAFTVATGNSEYEIFQGEYESSWNLSEYTHTTDFKTQT